MSEAAIFPSVCTLDCPDTCSLSVRVEGGEVVEVRGSHANPYTAGAICNKVARYYPEYLHGSARLRQPLLRTGPRGGDDFVPISWDEAIERVAAGFRAAIDAHGPQSVLPLNYAGPHGELGGGSMDRRFFYKMGATRLDRGPLCGGVRGMAYTSLFGNTPGMAPEQAAGSDLIAVWGNNVTVSNLHLTRVIKAARAQGAKLVVVDPKRIKIAERADVFVQIKPGTDVVLAMALAAELQRRGALDVAFVERWVHGFEAYMAQAQQYTPRHVAELCGVDELQFYQLVDLYQSAGALATSCGNGIERGRSGGSGLRAAMALNALLGQHGRPGAGVIARPGLAAPKTTARLHGEQLIPPDTRCFNIVDVPERLLDPQMKTPVRAVMIYNHNPVATHPEQGRMIEALSQPQVFVAGCDVVMTDSMRYCDVILPACSSFEYDDIYAAYGQNYVQRAAPVIPPVGQSLPNTEIFRRLAAAMGYTEALFQASDKQLMDDAMDAAHPQFAGAPPSEMPLERALVMRARDGAELVLCDNHKPATASGRIELFSEEMEARFGYGVPRFEAVEQDLPFVLITPSSRDRTNATFGSCAASAGVEPLEMHPADAAALGLADGQLVRACNARAEVQLRLQLSEAMQRGVLYSPKGAWRHSSASGYTTNALIPAQLRTDIGDGACYNETFVEVLAAG